MDERDGAWIVSDVRVRRGGEEGMEDRVTFLGGRDRYEERKRRTDRAEVGSGGLAGGVGFDDALFLDLGGDKDVAFVDDLAASASN